MQGEKSFVYFSMNIENLLRKHSIFYPASTVRILRRMFFCSMPPYTNTKEFDILK